MTISPLEGELCNLKRKVDSYLYSGTRLFLTFIINKFYPEKVRSFFQPYKKRLFHICRGELKSQMLAPQEGAFTASAGKSGLGETIMSKNNRLFRTCYAKLLVSSASELAIRGFSALAGGSKTDLSEIILKALLCKVFNII
ncbi:hypothetical protein [Microcoleus sp. D2_18a_D3]|uniref:hypothetical protein n=1 Tax=Microcoleus sp. D2_18a_D3 TaxID=3055330 RepID=UPI002FD1786B